MTDDPQVTIRRFNSHLHILERPAAETFIRISTGVTTVTIEAEVNGCERVISATASGPEASSVAGWMAFLNLLRPLREGATRLVESWHHDTHQGWVRDDYELVVDGVRHGMGQEPVNLEWRLTVGITEGP